MTRQPCDMRMDLFTESASRDIRSLERAKCRRQVPRKIRSVAGVGITDGHRRRCQAAVDSLKASSKDSRKTEIGIDIGPRLPIFEMEPVALTGRPDQA